MREDESLKCLAAIVAAWPWPEFSDERLALYARMIVDLDFDGCKAAVERLILTANRQPSIAEVRAEMQQAMSGRPDPEVAWGEVNKAIGKYGASRIPKFSCPELAQAVDAIGWQSICKDENTSSTRARFIDAYRSINDSSNRSEVLGARSPERALGNSPNTRMLGRASETSLAANKTYEVIYWHKEFDPEGELSFDHGDLARERYEWAVDARLARDRLLKLGYSAVIHCVTREEVDW